MMKVLFMPSSAALQGRVSSSRVVRPYAAPTASWTEGIGELIEITPLGRGFMSAVDGDYGRKAGKQPGQTSSLLIECHPYGPSRPEQFQMRIL